MRKLTQEEVEKRLGIYNISLLEPYTGNRGKITVKCGCGKNFTVWQAHLLDGRTKGCRKCFDPVPGQKFDLLTVKEVNNHWCYCMCECGTFCSVGVCQLLSRHVRSCGCLLNRKGAKNPLWSGYHDVGTWLMKSIKHCAQIKKRDFDLNIEFLWNLFLKQDKKCALSGINLIMSPSPRGLRSQKEWKHTASLDRIDSNKGYTKDNVQWVHKEINLMKSNLTQDAFINWCLAVTNNKLRDKNA